VLAYIFLDE